MSETRKLAGTIDEKTAQSLHAGDQVLFTGTVYVARDAAHKRLIDLLDAGEELPFPVENAIIYYAGPAPAKPGQVIGPCGPTSSYRMDPYAPRLLDLGVRAMIGKGARSQSVIDAIVRNRCVYFAAVGGAAAYIAKSIASAQIVSYEDLGTEAIRRLEVVNMPLTVAIDCAGGNVYTQGPAAYLASTAR